MVQQQLQSINEGSLCNQTQTQTQTQTFPDF